MEATIVELAKLFGAPGLIIGYLIWQQQTTGKERLAADRDLIASNREQAVAFTKLATIIERLDR